MNAVIRAIDSLQADDKLGELSDRPEDWEGRGHLPGFTGRGSTVTNKQTATIVREAKRLASPGATFLEGVAKIRESYNLTPAQTETQVVERIMERLRGENAHLALTPNQERTRQQVLSALARGVSLGAAQTDLDRNIKTLDASIKSALIAGLLSARTQGEFSAAYGSFTAIVGPWNRTSVDNVVATPDEDTVEAERRFADEFAADDAGEQTGESDSDQVGPRLPGDEEPF